MSDNKKILLAAVNSKYIHTNTAVRYLDRILKTGGFDSSVLSFTINDDRLSVLGDIVSMEPAVLCFSCYIWNISLIYLLCRDIRKIRPGIKIILGGPEVTYEPAEALEKSGADLIIRGEGEEVIRPAVEALLAGEKTDKQGTFYSADGKIIDNGIAITEDLAAIPSPFTDNMPDEEKGRLIYYEASRGCPFRCIYCLSSASTGVRYFPLERVFSDIENILKHEPGIVKFTDRSFNISSGRTDEILAFIKSLDTDTCFHLEIYPDGLEESTLSLMESMPPGRIQIEAGIQSANPETLRLSGRPQDSRAALSNVSKLAAKENVHIHLDLIAGLPEEGIESFSRSFDLTMEAKPHVLQVGFLKMLKGTSARNLTGYEYESEPPYEVLSSPSLSFGEIRGIKAVEHCVELFHNTGKFRHFLSYMYRQHGPYAFYKELSEHCKIPVSVSRDAKYEILSDYVSQAKEVVEYLRFDFMSAYKSKKIPGFLGGTGVSHAEIFDLLKNERFRSKYLGKYHELSPKKLFKIINISRFTDGAYMFIYDKTDPVTGLFDSVPVEI